MFEERITRRDILKKAAYVTPVVLTFGCPLLPLEVPVGMEGMKGMEGMEGMEGMKETKEVEEMEKKDLSGSGIMKEMKDMKEKGISEI
jgi:hypothetical protein